MDRALSHKRNIYANPLEPQVGEASLPLFHRSIG